MLIGCYMSSLMNHLRLLACVVLSDFILELYANATMMYFVVFVTQHGTIPFTLPDLFVVALMMLLELTNELNLGTL